MLGEDKLAVDDGQNRSKEGGEEMGKRGRNKSRLGRGMGKVVIPMAVIARASDRMAEDVSTGNNGDGYPSITIISSKIINSNPPFA